MLSASANFRVGLGWDFHRFLLGRKLILGSVEIPYEYGLLGHSDGDVLLHAIGDALLGAAGERDIGYHFPDTDPQYKGIASSFLLEKVCDIIARDGYQIVNIDCIVVAEAPRLYHYIPEMVEKVASLLGISSSQIGIKAKTAEGVGEIGKEMGIAAYAVVLLVRAQDKSGPGR